MSQTADALFHRCSEFSRRLRRFLASKSRMREMEYSVETTSGLRAKWFGRGATLAELHVPDESGKLADVVLGFDREDEYASAGNQHFGATTGRYANRIARGQFSIDGREYRLAVNNGPNHLHGGVKRSLDKVDWDAEPLADERGKGVRFTYTSPDGEESFPGALAVTVDYLLTDDNGLHIEYAATTDAPTPVNLTNHSYFNLAGHGSGSVMNHLLRIDADAYTPTDEHLIPTGEIRSLDSTPLDFRETQPLGARLDQLTDSQADGYDLNYVLNGSPGTVREIASLYDPASGRIMRVHTDQPGVQLYTGNGLHGQVGKQGRKYEKHSAMCLETQHYPDSPNQPSFPSTILRPGQTYRHVCVYQFGN